jgi:hypothetical protein
MDLFDEQRGVLGRSGTSNELKSLSGIAVANVGLGVVVLGGGKPALLI